MTIQDLFRSGHLRVRPPGCNPFAYFQLTAVEFQGERVLGPWAKLFDPPGQIASGKALGSDDVLLFALGNGDEWEPYEGKIWGKGATDWAPPQVTD